MDVHGNWKLINIYIYILHSHYFLFLFFILSCFHSPFSVSLFSLPLCLLFLPPQTLLSSSQTHHQSTRAQLPQTHRRRPTLGCRPDPFRPLFSIFGISALCFELCLCFGFVLRVVLVLWLCVSGSRLCSGLVDRSGFPWIRVLARGSEWLLLMVVLASG